MTPALRILSLVRFDMHRLKVVTIVGTRPEIIRLSRVIAVLSEVTAHTLIHTGQNYDYELNEVFFEQLGLVGRIVI